ncbi:MAG: hypothetical protein PHP64_04120 [Actinomycetota bacterium]|nr:hypothetical protein [Actinomycetota bacterium]
MRAPQFEKFSRLAFIKSEQKLGQPGLKLRFYRKVVTEFLKYRNLEKRKGYCCICGRQTYFMGVEKIARSSFWCSSCSSNARNRSLANAIMEQLKASQPSLREWLKSPDAQKLRVWQLQANGPLHWALHELPGHVPSEYIEGIESGMQKMGIRCEDVMCSSFESETLDLIISEDVMEHIPDLYTAQR